MIKNNVCSMVVGTNGDIYSGTCEYHDIKLMYIIAFEKGSQARGHIVKNFILRIIKADGSLVAIDSFYKDTIQDEILKEILKGF